MFEPLADDVLEGALAELERHGFLVFGVVDDLSPQKPFADIDSFEYDRLTLILRVVFSSSAAASPSAREQEYDLSFPPSDSG